MMFSGGVEASNPKAAGLLEKQQTSLEVNILPANDTGKKQGPSLVLC